jgi:hypothetical protein
MVQNMSSKVIMVQEIWGQQPTPFLGIFQISGSNKIKVAHPITLQLYKVFAPYFVPSLTLVYPRFVQNFTSTGIIVQEILG